jgi:hypothetical protein
MSFMSPSAPPAAATPVTPTPPPPVLAPQGSKPGQKPQTKTFLGTADVANAPTQSGNQTGKTLLGQ